MKKALIICAAGMSSSMVAKKATEHFSAQGKDIEVTATTLAQAPGIIEKDEFDLYLISPQAKMAFDNLKKSADAKNKPMENIPPQAYVPIPMGTDKLAQLIEANI